MPIGEDLRLHRQEEGPAMLGFQLNTQMIPISAAIRLKLHGSPKVRATQLFR